MKSSGTPYSSDWIAVSLRWMFLVAWITVRSTEQPLDLRMWPILALLAWNMAMTILAALNVRLVLHRYLNVVADISLTLSLYWIEGGPGASTAWIGLLPILTSAVYFEFIGTIVTGALFALVVFFAEFGLRGSDLLTTSVWVGAGAASGVAVGGLMAVLIRMLSTTPEGLAGRRPASESSRDTATSSHLRPHLDAHREHSHTSGSWTPPLI